MRDFNKTLVVPTRKQLKRQQVEEHNARYQEAKEHPELYDDRGVRNAVIETVKGFKEGLGIK